MQVIVVADKDRETVGRQLAYLISQAVTDSNDPSRGPVRHTAALWTEQHYRDNEAGLFGGTAAVVFIGPSRPAKDLVAVMPVTDYFEGATCYRGGRRAVLLANDSTFGYSDAEIMESRKRLIRETKTLRRSPEPKSLDSASFSAADVELAREVRELYEASRPITQVRYEYLAAHFVAQELAPLTGDI